MKLAIVKSDWLEDWYTIERAVHAGRMWIEYTGPNTGSLRCSSRISDADVEGTLEEMQAIAQAIKERKPCDFRRCAVHFEKDGAHFCSPRNSTVDGVVSLDEADDLAEQILALGHT